MHIRCCPQGPSLALILVLAAGSARAQEGYFPSIPPERVPPVCYYSVLNGDVEPHGTAPAVHREPARPEKPAHRLVCWPFHKKKCDAAPCPTASHPPAKDKEPAKLPDKEPAPKMDVPPVEPVFQPEQAAAGGGDTVAMNMIGDFIAPGGFAKVQFSSIVFGGIYAPSVTHSFKIANNNNVEPVDRIFGAFYAYTNFADRVNPPSVGQMNVFEQVYGFEKTFLGGRASVIFEVPIDTVDGPDNRVGGADWAFGDLAVALKFVLWDDRANGRLVSGGLAVSIPTGPDTFADMGPETAPSPPVFEHHGELQPWVGWVAGNNRGYVHGFTSVAIAMDDSEATLMYNDLGAGWYLRRDRSGDRFVSAIVPTAEVHINTPLSHRGWVPQLTPGTQDILGVPNWVVLTQGIIFEFNRRSTLAIAIGEPVTGPKPYDVEGLVQFNWRF